METVTMTTTEPVTAHDLAEALREAIDNNNAIIWIDDVTPEYDWEAPSRWQSLLDRFDAQVREAVEYNLAHTRSQRDGWMTLARKWRATSHPDLDPASPVEDARACNWQALRLRRELRRLGGKK